MGLNKTFIKGKKYRINFEYCRKQTCPDSNEPRLVCKSNPDIYLHFGSGDKQKVLDKPNRGWEVKTCQKPSSSCDSGWKVWFKGTNEWWYFKPEFFTQCSEAFIKDGEIWY